MSALCSKSSVLMMSQPRIADIAACIIHGFFYFLVPPWQVEA
jgi:hypothetical protein